MSSMEVKDIIRKRRLELGLSYAELGKICDVDKTTVRKWELGLIENMRRDKMVLLSNAIGVSPLVLLGVEEYIPDDEEQSLLSNGKIKIYQELYANKFEHELTEIDNPYPNQNGPFFGLEVHDEQLTILKTLRVYALFKKQDTAKNGEVVAVSINSEKAVIKKYYKFDDIVVLRDTTNEECEPITLVGDQVKEISILGKFVGVISPFMD